MNKAGTEMRGLLRLFFPPSIMRIDSEGSASAKRPAVTHATVPPMFSMQVSNTLLRHSSGWNREIGVATSCENNIVLFAILVGRHSVQTESLEGTMRGRGIRGVTPISNVDLRPS